LLIVSKSRFSAAVPHARPGLCFPMLSDNRILTRRTRMRVRALALLAALLLPLPLLA